MKRWIIGILLGGLLLCGCDRVTYVNVPTRTTDAAATTAGTVSTPTTKPTTGAPTLPPVTSKPTTAPTTAPSEPDRTEPEPPVTRPPETEPPVTEPAPTTEAPTAPTEPAPTTEPTTAPTEPEPTTEPTTAPTEPTDPPREDTLFYALVYGVDGRRSGADLPALTLEDTLCSEAAMAIQHYLSTGATPTGCTVVALDPALTDGEMVDLFLTLCGDETILNEANTRYGVALTSDNGVYYAAGIFA